MTTKFKWDAWDFDCDGEAYIIAKRVCAERDNVPDFIIREDNLPLDYKDRMTVEEGWCKYQVRTIGKMVNQEVDIMWKHANR